MILLFRFVALQKHLFIKPLKRSLRSSIYCGFVEVILCSMLEIYQLKQVKVWGYCLMSSGSQCLSAIAKKRPSLIAYAGKCCQVGVAVDIGSTAFMTSLNLLSNNIFAVDLADLCLDSAKELRDLVWNVMMETGKRNLVNFFPILAMIDPQGIRNRVMVHLAKILQLFGGLIDERLNSRRKVKVKKLHKSNAENDVIDILLNLNQEIDRTHIERTDTTSSTVEWAMAELLRNPECLKKAKAELEQTIGKGKPIQERDTSQLPYLQAIPRKTEHKKIKASTGPVAATGHRQPSETGSQAPQVPGPLADLAKTHGPIMSLKLGQITSVVISSSALTWLFLHQPVTWCPLAPGMSLSIEFFRKL
ncbi:hypothetical protein Vadar_000169 [Vaccinium darrowii]|uniref:Uncharacterized protein n=1 Tax=Vaccinium darrowii TaxID=229202 RepID=A0ACB7XWD5_9ERIC|nr:hypothetical protein Vadar_000169 [Vaccinium darrowii]